MGKLADIKALGIALICSSKCIEMLIFGCCRWGLKRTTI